MPIFNRAHIVEETLQSIIGQSYKHWECIIVDDSSNDNTYKRVSELIANDNRFKLFERPKNKTRGASSCRNYGISKTSGEFIQFFDSDDIMHPKHLERKINIIDDHDLVICKVQYFSGQFSDQFKDSTKDLEYKTRGEKEFIDNKKIIKEIFNLFKLNYLKIINNKIKPKIQKKITPFYSKKAVNKYDEIYLKIINMKTKVKNSNRNKCLKTETQKNNE